MSGKCFKMYLVAVCFLLLFSITTFAIAAEEGGYGAPEMIGANYAGQVHAKHAMKGSMMFS